MLSLIDFWRLQRKHRGEKTIVRACHKRKAEVLTDLVLGRLPTPNLMILEPPRIGKTDLGVRAFQAWAMSYFPDSEFINASYAADLSVSNTRYVRETLTADWYRRLRCSTFGATVELRGENASGRQDYFFTREGGSIKGVGVGGGITGFGAGKLRKEFGGAIIMDDILKAQDKDSPTMRKDAIDWLHGTLESRRNRKKKPMTPMILIMQRLHPQDPAGHLLSTERSRWTVVQIPAIDDAGQSIWPARISLEEMEYMREKDPETYWAQYMQQPSNEQYLLLRPEWWNFWTDINAVERRITLKIITADTAFKEKDSADFSVLQCWGFEIGRAAYLLDQVRGRWEFPELLSHAREFVKKHAKSRPGITPATEAWVEDRASGTSLVQTLRREGLPFREWLPPHADEKILPNSTVLSGPDKTSRVKQSSIPISSGRVFLPWPGMAGFRWSEGLVSECGAFTSDDSHLYDDQVDTMTEALLIWMQRGGGVGELPVWKTPPLKWDDWEHAQQRRYG